MTSRASERKLGNPVHQGLLISDSARLSTSTNNTNCSPRSGQVANKQLVMQEQPVYRGSLGALLFLYSIMVLFGC